MNDENRNPADPNPPVEPHLVEPIYNPDAPIPAPAEKIPVAPIEIPTEPIESQLAEPIYNSNVPNPTPAAPVEDHGSFQIPVVETEPVVETPAKPVETPVAEALIEPTFEPAAEIEMPEEEIIVGAPSRPGDKPEKPESEFAPQNYAPTTPATSVANSTPKNKTGFRPDGVTPLDPEEKIFAAIGYISFLAFLPLITRRDSEFAQHHAWQAVVVFLGFLFLLIFGGFLGLAGFISFLMVIEFIGGFLFAYKGDWFKIPVVYDLSLKLREKMPPQNPPAANTPSAN
ncbi:MAG: hypothetical protein WCV72_04170 [Patescibacteria group bacterium]|jgi:uncharacterized membrane protein